MKHEHPRNTRRQGRCPKLTGPRRMPLPMVSSPGLWLSDGRMQEPINVKFGAISKPQGAPPLMSFGVEHFAHDDLIAVEGHDDERPVIFANGEGLAPAM